MVNLKHSRLLGLRSLPTRTPADVLPETLLLGGSSFHRGASNEGGGELCNHEAVRRLCLPFRIAATHRCNSAGLGVKSCSLSSARCLKPFCRTSQCAWAFTPAWREAGGILSPYVRTSEAAEALGQVRFLSPGLACCRVFLLALRGTFCTAIVYVYK